MIDPLKIGVTALQAFGRKLGNTAHNIANVSTDGFRSNRTQMREEQNGGVSSVVMPPPVRVQQPPSAGDGRPELSEVELPTEMTSLIAAKRGYEANIRSMQIADEAEEALLDIKG